MAAPTDSRLNAANLLADGALMDRLEAHALRWFPKECCALLVIGRDGPRAILAENRLDDAHAKDPERFPRTAENGYLLDGRLIEDAIERGEEVVAIVHSHVHVGAYFSEEDRRQAIAPWGEALHPDVAYVVLDVQAGAVEGFKVFAWSGEAMDFIEI